MVEEIKETATVNLVDQCKYCGNPADAYTISTKSGKVGICSECLVKAFDKALLGKKKKG